MSRPILLFMVVKAVTLDPLNRPDYYKNNSRYKYLKFLNIVYDKNLKKGYIDIHYIINQWFVIYFVSKKPINHLCGIFTCICQEEAYGLEGKEFGLAEWEPIQISVKCWSIDLREIGWFDCRLNQFDGGPTFVRPISLKQTRKAANRCINWTNLVFKTL